MEQEPIMSKEKYHENEAVQYYCKVCNICICHKCSIVSHNRHAIKSSHMMEESNEELCAAEDKVTRTVQEIIRIVKEREKAVKAKLTEIKVTQQGKIGRFSVTRCPAEELS